MDIIYTLMDHVFMYENISNHIHEYIVADYIHIYIYTYTYRHVHTIYVYVYIYPTKCPNHISHFLINPHYIPAGSVQAGEKSTGGEC